MGGRGKRDNQGLTPTAITQRLEGPDLRVVDPLHVGFWVFLHLSPSERSGQGRHTDLQLFQRLAGGVCGYITPAAVIPMSLTSAFIELGSLESRS